MLNRAEVTRLEVASEARYCLDDSLERYWQWKGGTSHRWAAVMFRL